MVPERHCEAVPAPPPRAGKKWMGKSDDFALREEELKNLHWPPSPPMLAGDCIPPSASENRENLALKSFRGA